MLTAWDKVLKSIMAYREVRLRYLREHYTGKEYEAKVEQLIADFDEAIRLLNK